MSLKDLSLSDIESFGGFTLAGFEPEIDRLNDTDKRLEMIRVIGQLPTTVLMAVMDLAGVKSLAEKSLNFVSTANSNRQHLDRIGSLAFFLPSDAWRSFNQDEVKIFLSQQQDQQLCLPESQSKAVAAALQQSFG